LAFGNKRTFVQGKVGGDLKLDVRKIMMDRKNKQHQQGKHKYKTEEPIVSIKS